MQYQFAKSFQYAKNILYNVRFATSQLFQISETGELHQQISVFGFI